jgi:hypothetical protein
MSLASARLLFYGIALCVNPRRGNAPCSRTAHFLCPRTRRDPDPALSEPPASLPKGQGSCVSLSQRRGECNCPYRVTRTRTFTDIHPRRYRGVKERYGPISLGLTTNSWKKSKEGSTRSVGSTSN